MEFYLILENTKAMVFNWEGGGGGDLRLNGKGEKNTVHKWLNFLFTFRGINFMLYNTTPV